MQKAKKDIIATVRDGYAFTAPCIELGALIVAETPRPEAKIRVPMGMLNRHGLIAGATGTGKTKTLQVMAEQLSHAGIPVFAADIKGDLSGLASPGEVSDKVTSRAEAIGQAWEPTAYPVELLRLGESGIGTPVRATITSFGPTLLAKVLQLNETQESSLGLIFHYADKAGLPLLDIKDLRAVITHLVSPEGKDELQELGGLAKTTAGVILRELINFAQAGGDQFFGEPEFDVTQLLRVAADGRGIISLLELPGVQDKPILFSTFLMWMLAELFEEMPEVGDPELPRLVFFFDEAHLLFKNASRNFLAALIQTARLIRSKGIGVFFVTQTPKDVHEDVLAQLGSRVQHQLRAFTPNDAAALKATVRTYPTSSYQLDELLQALGIGEAVVTVMSEKGAPTPVAHAMLPAPQSLMAPSGAETLEQIVATSPLSALYRDAIDRESAYERLTGKIAANTAPVTPTPYGAPAGANPMPTSSVPSTAPAPPMSDADRLEAEILGTSPPPPAPVPAPPMPQAPMTRKTRTRTSKNEDLGASLVENFLKSASTVLGREIARGAFGTRRRRKLTESSQPPTRGRLPFVWSNSAVEIGDFTAEFDHTNTGIGANASTTARRLTHGDNAWRAHVDVIARPL